MRRVFLAVSVPLLVGACVAFAPDNGIDQEAVVCAEVGSAPVIYTKDGFPIIDDQACIPEPEVLGIQIGDRGPTIPDCDADERRVGLHCVAKKPAGPPDNGPTCDGANEQVNSAGDACECVTGYSYEGDICVQNGSGPTCDGANEQVNSAGDACECVTGYHYEGEVCVADDSGPEPVCEGDELWKPIGGSGKCTPKAKDSELTCNDLGEPGDWVSHEDNPMHCVPKGWNPNT